MSRHVRAALASAVIFAGFVTGASATSTPLEAAGAASLRRPAAAASFQQTAKRCIRRDRTCEYSTQCCSGLVCVDHGSKGLVCAPGR